MCGVLLAILIVLNLRNGFGLANVGGNTQTGVIGAILIGSVLAQNLIERVGSRRGGRSPRPACRRRATDGGAGPIAGGAESSRAHVSINNTGGRRPMKFTRLSVGVIGALALLGAACGSDERAPRRRPGTRRSADARRPRRHRPGPRRPAWRPGGGDVLQHLAAEVHRQRRVRSSQRGRQGGRRQSSASPNAEFVGPASCADSTGQVEFVTNAVTQGVDAIMISNNAGDQIDPAIKAAAGRGHHRRGSWDSPIPSGEGESLFVAQVDFDETGKVMADMAV